MVGHGQQRQAARGALSVLAALIAALFSVDKVFAFSVSDPNTWPFIPVPEVATDPNGGTTYGILPVFLFHDQQGQISNLFAPDLTNNTTLGFGGTFRFLSYPSADVHWYAVAGAQIEKTRRLDLSYARGLTRQRWWSLSLRLFWEHDPTERFYGVGNMSPTANQSNYTTKQLYFESVLGVNLSEQFQVAWVMRPRYVRIGRGGFSSLPFTGQLFPHLKGLNGGSEFLNELVASYDTRDSVDLPRSGGLIRLFAGVADRRLGSSISYNRFGLEVRRYTGLGGRFTLATHAYLEFMPAGKEVSFWSLARLGGYPADYLTNTTTQRGYGVGRWADNNAEGFNVELRTRVYSATLFSTRGTLELAPFIDLGRVSHLITDNPLNRFHVAGGIGARAVAEPFVLGYLDFGYAGNGISIFTGIDYPF